MPDNSVSVLPPPTASRSASSDGVIAPHLGYLDGLRALAALTVLLHHCFSLSGLAFTVVGHYAVDVFIVLSGFCLMLPLERRAAATLPGGAIGFYGRRARRILPTYYSALAFSLALDLGFGLVHWGEAGQLTRFGLLTHLLLVQDFFTRTSLEINSPLWTIAVEWRIYFLFPLLVWSGRRWGVLPTTLAAVALSGLLFLLLRRHAETVTDMHGVSLPYIGLFAMGMLGASIAYAAGENISVRLRRAVPWTAVLVFLTVLVTAATLLGHGPFQARDYGVGIWAMTLIVAAATQPGGVLRRLLSWPPLVRLGTFAYSLYLVHMPLLCVLRATLFRPWQGHVHLLSLLYALVAVPLTIAVAYAFFLLCERPFLMGRMRKSSTK